MGYEADADFTALNRDFIEMHGRLLEDINVLLNEFQGKNKQVRRRAVCRALFSYIEGTVFSLKKEILLLRKQEGWEPKGREKWLLTEKKDVALRSGKIVTRPFHVPLATNLLYAVSEWAFIHWFDFKIDTGDFGWRCLLEAAKVRNRVTHPKYPHDLTITDEEVQLMVGASRWFNRTLRILFAECAEAYYRRACILRESVLEN